MPELRKDPITGRWVAYAPERARRPLHYDVPGDPIDQEWCPFCPGHEDATPHEVLSYRETGTAPNSDGWRVRVVPNKFPALAVEGEMERLGEGIYDRMNGIGAHEVIIETPEHVSDLIHLPETQVREVLWAYRDRLVDLRKDGRMVHGQVFKNKGAAAGASLPHTHSQLITQPVVPAEIALEIAGAKEFHDYRGRCIYCDLIRQEEEESDRVVLQTTHFLVCCPYASRFAFEMWILPREHASNYEQIPRELVDDLGSVLRQCLAKLAIALDQPAYNYVLHTAPFRLEDPSYYHWHLEILPRMTQVAGFEWGSGSYINTVLPEDAAKFLRKTAVES